MVTKSGLFNLILLALSFVLMVSSSQAGRDDVIINCGKSSFANRVVSFKVGSPGPVSTGKNPQAILGPNDYSEAQDKGYVTLGCRGTIVLEFKQIEIIDIPGPDLHVFEIGPRVEPTKLAISKDGRSWVEVGQISGGTAQVDISGHVRPGDRFRFVRLTDLATGCGGDWPGADIDAVAALGCERVPGSPADQTKPDKIKKLEKQLQEAKRKYEKEKNYLDDWEQTLEQKKNDRGFLIVGKYQFVRSRGYFGGSQMLDFSNRHVERAVNHGLGGSPSLMRLYDPIYGSEHLSREIAIYEEQVRRQKIDTGLAAQQVRDLEDQLRKLKAGGS